MISSLLEKCFDPNDRHISEIKGLIEAKQFARASTILAEQAYGCLESRDELRAWLSNEAIALQMKRRSKI